MKKLLLMIMFLLLVLGAVSAQPTLPAISDITVNETDAVSIEITLTEVSDNGSTSWWTNFSSLTLAQSNNTYAQYTWTTGYNDAGTYAIMFNASDDNSSDSGTMTITVNNKNRAPSITSTAVTTAIVGHAYSYNVTATDADSDTIQYSLTTFPEGMSINTSSGLISWTPTTAGVNVVTAQVSDTLATDTQTFNVTVSAQSYGLTLADVTLGGSSQEREKNTTVTLTVSNSGTETITDISLSSSASSTYLVSFSSATIASLASGSSTTVTLTGYVPDDKDAAKESIGTITATGTSSGNQVTATSTLYMQAENNLEIRDLDITVNDDSENVDDGDTVDVFPASEIEVVIELKNSHSDIDMEDITVTIYNDDLDVDEDEDLSKIKDGKKETLELKFSIDEDADEDNYDVEITVEGEDDNGAIHTETWTIVFDLNEEGIIITKALLVPEAIGCNENSVDLDVELTNVGTRDEDDIGLEIVADSLDYEKRVSYLEIDEDEKIAKTYTIPLDENLESGTHIIEITSFLDMDEQSHVKYVYLAIPSGCSVEQDTGITVVPSDIEEEKEEVEFVDSGTGESLSFSSNVWMTVLLVLANILVLVVIVILVMKFLIRT